MNKNKTTYIIYSTLILLLFVNVFLLYLLNIEKENSIKISNQSELLMSSKSLALETNFKTSLSNNNLNVKYIENTLIKNYLSKGTLLVVRISELHCKECVNSILLKIINLKKNKNIRIILFTNYSTINSVKIIKDQFELNDIPSYNIDKLNLPVEQYSYPYCFTIDSTYNIENIFVPDKNAYSLTSMYFDIITMRYFKEN